MRNVRILALSIASAVLIFLNGCTDEPEEVVLDGITIGDQVTKIKVSEINVGDKTSTTIELSSSIAELDESVDILDFGFVLSSEHTLPTSSDLKISFGPVSDLISVDSVIQGLNPEMIYYVRSFVEAEMGFGYGNVVAFQTSEIPADVIVINEGNFLSGDGSFSTYNSITGEVKLSVFASANGFPVAATIQRAEVYNGKIYATTNSADKLEIFNAETFKSVAYIKSGLKNPYDFAAIGNTAYVTNWGTLNSVYAWEESFIAVVDLTTNTITSTISRNEKPQHVIAVGEYFYLSNVGGSSVSVFEASSNTEVKTIDVSYGPDAMVLDANGDVWVMCTSGNLVQIDTETQEVIKTISGISGAGYNEKLAIDAEGDDLYFMASGAWPSTESFIYSINISDSEAPSAAVLTGENYYGFGISPSGQLYVADANAFQGNGTISVYSLSGSLVSSFAAGRGPNGFIFR